MVEPNLQPAFIAKHAKQPQALVEAVCQGVTKEELHGAIVALWPHLAGTAIDTARMNFVASLRTLGYQITGGRAGGHVYLLTGWAEPERQPTVDEWTGVARATFDWLQAQERITLQHQAIINARLACREQHYHESSFGYLWSYELARDAGFLVKWRKEPCVVIQRFASRPRLRIFALDNSAEAMMSLAQRIAPGSVSDISIINLTREQCACCQQMHPDGSVGKRREAVVNISDVVDHLDEHFNKRGLTTLRKAEREIAYVATPRLQDGLSVLDNWKRLNLSKHRQPATTRDIVAMEAGDALPYSITGYRGDAPVSIMVNDVLPGKLDTATLLVEKSLNYSTFPDGSECPGGRYGTADANMIFGMKLMQARGLVWFNLGGYDGGGAGLPQHKERYARIENDVYSLAFHIAGTKGEL